jgi:sigma-54 specific flagellar transcriptional regulator A
MAARSSWIAVDVRVVAATHRDLQQRIADGSFREDLFYRLNIFPIHLPSLQARREDIPELAAHFAAEFGAGSPAFALSASALDALSAYDWPGNVRELRNWAERASVLYRGKEVDAAGTQFLLSLGRMRAQIDAGEAVTPLARPPHQEHAVPAIPVADTHRNVTALPFLKDSAPEAAAVASQRAPDTADDGAEPMRTADRMLRGGTVNLKSILQDLEVEFIESALARTGHTVSEAAKMLGLQRTTLCEKMRKYGFERKDGLQQASATA